MRFHTSCLGVTRNTKFSSLLPYKRRKALLENNMVSTTETFEPAFEKPNS